MNLLELNKSIVKKHKQGLYIFVGEEVALKDIYIKQISDMYNMNYAVADSLVSVIPKLGVKSLINKNNVYLIKEDLDITKNEKIWDTLKTIDTNNCIILTYTNIRKNTKFYKYFEDEIVLFERMSEPLLVEEVKKEIELSKENCIELVRLCEHDYGRLKLEIDKVKTYSNIQKIPPNLGYNQLLTSGGVNIPSEAVNFNIIDYLLNGNFEKFIDITNNLSYENAISLLSMLYVGIKNTYLVKSARSKNVSGETGLSYYLVKNILTYKNVYSVIDLEEKMVFIIETINNIKNGTIDSKIALPYSLVKLIQ